MKKLISYLGLPALIAGLLVSIPAIATSAAASAPKDPSAVANVGIDSNTTSAQQQSVGERKFNQNCSRCHRTPEGFSPSISGTILKHMRVRASLSEQDERDILHFLNL